MTEELDTINLRILNELNLSEGFVVKAVSVDTTYFVIVKDETDAKSAAFNFNQYTGVLSTSIQFYDKSMLKTLENYCA